MLGDADTDVTAGHAGGCADGARRAPADRRTGVGGAVDARAHGAGSEADIVTRIRSTVLDDPRSSSPTARTSSSILRARRRRRASRGFTTNPTLMWKAGLTDYTEFAGEPARARSRTSRSRSRSSPTTPAEIRRQARMIATWGANVYVKIPVTTTRGESLADVVREPRRRRRAGQRHRALHARRRST